MKLLKYFLLLSLVSVSSILMAADNRGGNQQHQSEDVVISGTVSSVDENRRIIVVAGKAIHMPKLGKIPFKRGQSVKVVTTKLKGRIFYLGRSISEQGGG